MTHQQNFAHDRLALYTFDNLVRFIRCWTNIRLLWQSPVESAKMYFSLMPQEKLPVWSVRFNIIFTFANCFCTVRSFISNMWKGFIYTSGFLSLRFFQNPCNDPRHKAILPPSLNCSNLTLPNTLIVGPQKTGGHVLFFCWLRSAPARDTWWMWSGAFRGRVV